MRHSLRRLFIILFAGLTGAFTGTLSSCQSPGPAHTQKSEERVTPDSSILISCGQIGGIRLSDSHQLLMGKVGAGNLSEHENSSSGHYTSIWEGTPKQLNIYWKEPKAPFKTIRYIETAASDAPYTTSEGIRVGISLRDLVKKNGHMPISFVNVFGTETNSGLITSFHGGDLDNRSDCFSGRLEWVERSNIYFDRLETYKKQKISQSSDYILLRVTLILSSFIIESKH